MTKVLGEIFLDLQMLTSDFESVFVVFVKGYKTGETCQLDFCGCPMERDSFQILDCQYLSREHLISPDV